MSTFHRVGVLFASLASCALFGSCGGGGGADTTTITLFSRGTIDGVANSDGTSNSTGIFPQCGSTPTVFARGIYLFDLPGTLAGKTIDAATLVVEQIAAGAGAYTAHGNVVADHVNFEGQVALSLTSFNGFVVSAAFGTLSTSATLGSKILSVTARVQADVDAARTTSSYRLHFSNEVGLGQGTAIFSDGEGTSPTAPLPQLVITFH